MHCQKAVHSDAISLPLLYLSVSRRGMFKMLDIFYRFNKSSGYDFQKHIKCIEIIDVVKWNARDNYFLEALSQS